MLPLDTLGLDIEVVVNVLDDHEFSSDVSSAQVDSRRRRLAPRAHFLSAGRRSHLSRSGLLWGTRVWINPLRCKLGDVLYPGAPTVFRQQRDRCSNPVVMDLIAGSRLIAKELK